MSKYLFGILFLLLFLNTSCARFFVKYDGTIKKKEKSRVAEHYFSEGMKYYLLQQYSEAESWFKKAHEINPEDAGLNYILSKVYLQKSDLDQALFFAQKAVKSYEQNPYYHIQVAEIYRLQSNISEAARVYKKMISLFPDAVEYYMTLASLYLYERKVDEAIAIYNSVENKFGKSPEVSRQKQELYIRMDNPVAALQESKSLMEAFPMDPGFKLSHAELLLNYKKTEEAKSLLKQLIAEDPENAYAAYFLAEIYKVEGKTDQYFNMITQVVNNPDMELENKINLLMQAEEGNKPKESSKVLQLAAKLPEVHPGNARAYMAYGDVLLEKNEKKAAWKQYLKAKEIDNTNYNLWSHLIILDSELREIDSMIVHSEKALEIYPNQASLWYLNGSAYMLSGRNEDAIAALEHGRKLASKNNQLLLQFYVLLGDSYNNLKDYLKSDQSYEEALKIDKDNAHVLNNYSYFLAERNERLEQALKMAERLMEIAPENAAYLDTYGWILYKMNKLHEARIQLEKAALKTNDGTIVEHFGDVLFKLGEIDKAVEEWKKARKYGQTSELIQKKISDRKLYE